MSFLIPCVCVCVGTHTHVHKPSPVSAISISSNARRLAAVIAAESSSTCGRCCCRDDNDDDGGGGGGGDDGGCNLADRRPTSILDRGGGGGGGADLVGVERESCSVVSVDSSSVSCVASVSRKHRTVSGLMVAVAVAVFAAALEVDATRSSRFSNFLSKSRTDSPSGCTDSSAEPYTQR